MEVNDITKPGIIRLARKAGVKTISDDCFNVIRKLIDKKLEDIIKYALIINSEHQTKILMAEDIYEALLLNGFNVAQSNDLNNKKF